jgi:ribosomal protein L35AE/L33A
MLAYLPLLAIILQALLLIAFLWNLIVNRQSYRSNNHNVLVQILQSKEVREAREYVATTLTHKDFSKNEWTDEDKIIASRVCGAYGTVGVFVQMKKITLDDIESYRINLLECYNVLKPFIMHRRTNTGEQYWAHYIYIVELLGEQNRSPLKRR